MSSTTAKTKSNPRATSEDGDDQRPGGTSGGVTQQQKQQRSHGDGENKRRQRSRGGRGGGGSQQQNGGGGNERKCPPWNKSKEGRGGGTTGGNDDETAMNNKRRDGADDGPGRKNVPKKKNGRGGARESDGRENPPHGQKKQPPWLKKNTGEGSSNNNNNKNSRTNDTTNNSARESSDGREKNGNPPHGQKKLPPWLKKKKSTEGFGNNNNKNNSRTNESSHNSAAPNRPPPTARQNSKTKKTKRKEIYPPYQTYQSCLHRYSTSDPTLIRGKIRVLPKRDGPAFVSCDRGSLSRDVLIEGIVERNRSLDGDYVFVELLPLGSEEEDEECARRPVDDGGGGDDVVLGDYMEGMKLDATPAAAAAGGSGGGADQNEENTGTLKTTGEEENGENLLNPDDFEEYDIGPPDNDQQFSDDDEEEDVNDETEESKSPDVEADVAPTWGDDQVQKRLWDPALRIRKTPDAPSSTEEVVGPQQRDANSEEEVQRKGRVIFVIPPKTSSILSSELTPGSADSKKEAAPRRTVVGTLTQMPGMNNNRFLLVPNNKALPRFMCPYNTRDMLLRTQTKNQHDGIGKGDDDDGSDVDCMYKAEYVYGSWSATDRWPPCTKLKIMGSKCNVEDETMALLIEHNVDHGDFKPDVLKDVEQAVQSGRVHPSGGKNQQSKSSAKKEARVEHEDLGWKPTPEMYQNRRDYRTQRIFTIDPTTAKDLDDALHIQLLPNGTQVEIGVHIADVSHFVKPDSAVDNEAMSRATTVYLVDRTVPMLPRPLCEIACSLNEDVERLAFSCVWIMNLDGTLETQGEDESNKKVWYGRTVIKSCARLDYATAQNIIEKKVATGEHVTDVDETLWPKSRQPTGGHTIDEVANDVRLMHKVAMARRKLRFQSGALALNGIKLAFQLEEDGETPKLCAPYPIRDSNRLVEEYMLLANYLVAQRLLTHAGPLALLRHHPPPIQQGLHNLVNIARESVGYNIDVSSSQRLQESLSQLGRECNDDLVMQCVTELAMIPMQPAEYIAAGEVDEELWKHFALNIPYYTHFTSPIRRYADVIVHRLLQATIDYDNNNKTEDAAITNFFPLSQGEVHTISAHCNDKRMGAKRAQERSDRVFLSIYLKSHPLQSTLGVVLSVGEKTFTIFVPSLGLNTLVFLDEHRDVFNCVAYTDEDENGGSKRRIVLTPKRTMEELPVGGADTLRGDRSWTSLEIKIFTKLTVSCHCKKKGPVDVKVMIVGPWNG